MAGTGLKVFFDSFSQPSRAVLLLLHANKIPYETHLIKIASGVRRNGIPIIIADNVVFTSLKKKLFVIFQERTELMRSLEELIQTSKYLLSMIMVSVYLKGEMHASLVYVCLRSFMVRNSLWVFIQFAFG